MGHKSCPACGYPLPEAVWLNGLSGQKRRLGEIILRAGQRGIHFDILIDMLYGDDPEGGPLHARAVLKTVICRLNKQLVHFGVRIHCRADFWRLYSTNHNARNGSHEIPDHRSIAGVGDPGMRRKPAPATRLH